MASPSTAICCSAERRGGGAGDDGAVGDREGAAVALAVDVAVGDRADDAALVGAHGREALELAVRRLGDDHLVLGEDRAAADLDVGGLREGVGAGGARWGSPPPTPRRWACCSVTVCSGRWRRHCRRSRCTPRGRAARRRSSRCRRWCAVEEGLGHGRSCGQPYGPGRPTPLSRGPRTTLTADPQQRPSGGLAGRLLGRRPLGRCLRWPSWPGPSRPAPCGRAGPAWAARPRVPPATA